MNKEGLVINTIDRGLADGNQCTVSGRESAACPRGMGSCRVFGGGDLNHLALKDDRHSKDTGEFAGPESGTDENNGSWGSKKKFINQWKQGTDMNALYDMNDRSRCPANPGDPLGPVKNRIRHAPTKVNEDDRMSGFYWHGIPYNEDGSKCTKSDDCSSGVGGYAKDLFAFKKEGFTNDTIEGFQSSEIVRNINTKKDLKGEARKIFEKLVKEKKLSQGIQDAFVENDVDAQQKLRDKMKYDWFGGGNDILHDSDALINDRDKMTRPRYSMRDAFVQTRAGKNDENNTPYGRPPTLIPVSCKIGPLTPTRHVCKSMQPFKWIPDPLQDMDNRAQYFEKSRKVHKCGNVTMDGTQGEGYKQECAQAGIFTRPTDNDLFLRQAYWDKTYTDPRRAYNKKDEFSSDKGHKSDIESNKINKFDQIFIENYLNPERNENRYHLQRNLKAQMVYEDEVRSYYQS